MPQRHARTGGVLIPAKTPTLPPQGSLISRPQLCADITLSAARLVAVPNPATSETPPTEPGKGPLPPSPADLAPRSALLRPRPCGHHRRPGRTVQLTRAARRNDAATFPCEWSSLPHPAAPI